jgi:drug/metabolite transporter (DMT)-like permease
MLAAIAAFVGMQSFVKLGREAGMSTADVMFYRSAPGLPVLYWMLKRRGQGLTPDEPRDILIRCLFGTLAMSTNFASMRWLSLAQFSTLSLTQPVFVALASPLLLSERVRKGTWAAIGLAGFGSLVLLWPGLHVKDVSVVPSCLALLSACASAMAVMWVRKATASEPPERVVFHFAAFASVLAFAVSASGGAPLQRPDDVPAARFALFVLGMGGFGTLGQICMTYAFSLGEAATVSLVGYSSIGLSVLVDALLFDVSPAASALIGAAFIVMAGVILVRSARQARRVQPFPEVASAPDASG